MASFADVATSGFTPTCSQLVLVIGLIERAVGTNTMKSWPRGKTSPGLAPPPVVSPTSVARFWVLRS